jgi:hypothetical protein
VTQVNRERTPPHSPSLRAAGDEQEDTPEKIDDKRRGEGEPLGVKQFTDGTVLLGQLVRRVVDEREDWGSAMVLTSTEHSRNDKDKDDATSQTVRTDCDRVVRC